MFNPPNIQRLKKKHKLSSYGIELRAKRICHGTFGIKALEGGYITAKQIEAARKAIIKHVKKIGILYIRIFPYLGVTNKPAETRMGKGKGGIAYWVSPVKAGKMLFEISGVSRDKAKEVLLLGAAKLPIKVKFL